MGRNKKRRINPMVYFGLAILAIAMVTIGFQIQPFAIDTGVEDGDFITGKGTFLGVPTYGYISCEESDEQVSTAWETFDVRSIACSNAQRADLVEECIVSILTPSTDEVSKANAQVGYQICDESRQCNLDWATATKINVRTAFVFQNPNKNYNIPLTEKQYVLVGYKEASLISFGGDFEPNKAEFKISFRPFFLKRHDIFSEQTGRNIVNSQDCTVGPIVESRFRILDVRGGGDLEQDLVVSKSELADLDNFELGREQQVTYLSNFVGIIPQFQLFDDDTKYCYDKKIYAVEEVETPSGTYKIANTGSNREIDEVDCCNTGDAVATKGAGYYCDNFEIKGTSQSDGASCDDFQNRCPIVGYQGVSGGKWYFQECIDGQCKTDFEQSECSSNTDCPDGYCNADFANPKNSECVEIVIEDYCGNTICDAGETYQTCPEDCDSPEPKDNFLVYLFIGLAFVAVLVVMLIIRQKMKGNGNGGFN
jgi:hypothetical protein